MTTAKVEIWKDCGYTEGGIEVPSSTTLSNPDYTYTDLQISREVLFSQIKVKEAYEELYDCSYLRMTMDMNNGDDIVLYGWVDSISCSSDTPNNPMTIIDWHVDYWRTYKGKVKYGSGIVTRRKENSTDVPQVGYSNRFVYLDDTQNLMDVNDIYWAFVNITVKDTGSTSDKMTTCLCYPVSRDNPTEYIYAMTSSGTVIGKFPTYYQTVTGLFDEKLELDPDAIYGCWLSPIPPSTVTYSENEDKRGVDLKGWTNWYSSSYSTTQFMAFRPFDGGTVPLNCYPERETVLDFETDDVNQYIVTDFDGQPVFSFPWGKHVSKCYYRVVNSDTSMYIAFRFTDDEDSITAGPNGLTCAIPLQSIPMSSNAKSSYVYSGQMTYDRQQMDIARSQAFTASVTSGLTGVASNVTMASIGGGKYRKMQYDNPLDMWGTKAGSGKVITKGMSMGTAGIMTAGASLAGASIDYLAQGYYNDAIMDSTLQYKANQTSTLTLPGSGTDWIRNGTMPKLCLMKWDDYSIQQRQRDIDIYGLTVFEPMTSCQTLINAGGPMRIENLTVTGKVPVGAKQYLRERFANGVRIV